MVVSPQDIAHVEQRLKIVKRSRANAAVVRRSSGSLGNSPHQQTLERDSPTPMQPTSAAPCSAYPTFSLRRLPKREEQAIEVLVMDCLDTLFFGGGGTAAPTERASKA